MIIKTLIENIPMSDTYKAEHGLSLYIETSSYKLLFDVGASELFLKNAEHLSVDIKDIDYLVISHGHYDHGGGLKAFLEHNSKAKIFIHENAFEPHSALNSDGSIRDIGLQKSLASENRIVFTSNHFTIQEGLELFSNVKKVFPTPSANEGLMSHDKTKPDRLILDDFSHEQSLIITEDTSSILVTGCSHNGIKNIINHYKTQKLSMPSVIIGGFHLSRPHGKTDNNNTIDRIASYLIDTKAAIYTCHCTGLKAYDRLKSQMGSQLSYLSAGTVIEI